MLGVYRELAQSGYQEPRQPDALALAFEADAIHAVVPVAAADQRQPVCANSARSPQRPQTVIVDASGFLRDLRQLVDLVLVGIQLAHCQIWNFHIEYAAIT